MKTKLIIILLAVSCALFTACSGTGPMNPDAHSLIDYFEKANRDSQIGQQACETDRINCVINEKEQGRPTDICFQNQTQCQNTVVEYWKKRINIRSQSACKATVIGPGSELDTDGDGVSNGKEFYLGLSPCHAETFQGVNDGDLDSDFDGKPNKSDDNPFCNPLYPSDCI